jgi:hypothetical protein
MSEVRAIAVDLLGDPMGLSEVKQRTVAKLRATLSPDDALRQCSRMTRLQQLMLHDVELARDKAAAEGDLERVLEIHERFGPYYAPKLSAVAIANSADRSEPLVITFDDGGS